MDIRRVIVSSLDRVERLDEHINARVDALKGWAEKKIKPYCIIMPETEIYKQNGSGKYDAHLFSSGFERRFFSQAGLENTLNRLESDEYSAVYAKGNIDEKTVVVVICSRAYLSNGFRINIAEEYLPFL